MSRMLPVVALTVSCLTGCSNNRGGLVDLALDKSLYTAETKAERLLRYYEIQGLLVRYAALFGGQQAERDAIAAANVTATGRMSEVFNCLHSGSVAARSARVDVKELGSHAARGANYCSFFDMRMMSYEASLIGLLKQSLHYDERYTEIQSMIVGFSTASVWTMATNLLTLAQETARDVRALNAFKADARELQFIAFHGSTITDPSKVPFLIGNLRPERAPPEDVERWLKAQDHGLRPTILIWHFREVSAFIADSCMQLNQDVELRDFQKTRCSTNLPLLDIDKDAEILRREVSKEKAPADAAGADGPT